MSTRYELGKDYGKSLLVGGLGAALGLAAVQGFLAVDRAEKEKTQKEDAAMEQIIKPAAVKVAQYAIDHATEKPRVRDGEYIFNLGTLGEEQTTLTVEIRKFGDKAPSASDVTWAQINEWKSPGVGDSEFGSYSGYSLQLQDSRWVGVGNYDQEAPYGDANLIVDYYSSAEQPYVDFEQNLDTAESIADGIVSHLDTANIR